MSDPPTARHRALIAFLLLVAGCDASERPAPAEQSDRTATSDTAGATPPAWVVSPNGAGPVRVGMTFAELHPLMAEPVDTAAIGAGCTFVTVEGAPPGLMFMVENRRLVRTDVVSGDVRTADGLGIGDDEAEVAAAYPNLRQMPHKYTNGNYLVVLPGAPGDSINRIVFETDGTRVTEYRAGVYPPVEYVERCG